MKKIINDDSLHNIFDTFFFNSVKSTIKGFLLNKRKIDICIAAPEDEEQRKLWGDWYYAQALSREFNKRGYLTSILTHEHWYDKSDAYYVLVLRGIQEYHRPPSTKQIFMMWVISHPADITIDEYNQFDCVFFASERLKKQIGPQIKGESYVLLQCYDEQSMTYKEEHRGNPDLLFIGNSRGVFRECIKYIIPTKHNLEIYGGGWEQYPVGDYLMDGFVEYEKVGQKYHDAKIVLNDHWSDMREYGIINNRIFDALSVGAFVISDYLPEIDDVFQGSVIMYKNKEDLNEKIDYYLSNKKERRRLSHKGQCLVLAEHTFSSRAEFIVNVINKHR